MNTELKRLVDYFCLYPGGDQNDLSKIRPVAEKLGHPDLAIHTGKGSMNKSQWLNFIEKMADEGHKFDLTSVKVEGKKIVYKGRITYVDGASMEIESEASFKDGMVVRVEPHEPEKYSKFYDIAAAADGDPVATCQ